uniref:Uncharacterized protein n=1 Tax=Mantoniella antarctica TaxID=81844 RepID=A0A7S0STW7_9CHLO
MDEHSRDAHTAAEEGNLWSITNFVKTKINFDINAPDHTGRTCLMLAAEAGHERVVEFLIANHASVTKQDQFNKRSAIHLACRKGRVEVLKLLLNHLSPDDRMEATNAKDGNGLTPLFLVGTRGCDSPECLKVLISEGARYNGIAVSVKTAGTAVLAAIRMKRGISGVGATATVAAESEGAAAESLDPEL